MDNDIHIKSADLCERCVYSDEFCEPYIDCQFCGQRMYASDAQYGCCCDTVKTGTPCPYFREAEG